jgi:ERCC4-type nuclease
MAEVIVGSLSIGDIAINRREGAAAGSTDPADYAILVERKDCTRSPTDFEASILEDGKRYFHQSENMKLAEAMGVILLEGDVYGNSTRMDLIQQVDGALTFAAAIQRMSVLPTLSVRHSAYVVLKLAQHQRYGLGYELGLRAEKPKAALDRAAFVLEGIPGVNAALARALLAHFGSVRAVTAANPAELKNVAGIGPKRAQEIYDVLNGTG